MKCPNCVGTGELIVFPRLNNNGSVLFSIPCSICNGTGILPSYYKYDLKTGKELKDKRIQTGLTLREYCKKYYYDIKIRSEEERGFFIKFRSDHEKSI